MSLKLNIVANYASQIYLSVLAILVLPLYLRLMGSKAYGLVGSIGLKQVGLLDMGLTATTAKETTRLRDGASTPLANFDIASSSWQILVKCA